MSNKKLTGSLLPQFIKTVMSVSFLIQAVIRSKKIHQEKTEQFTCLPKIVSLKFILRSSLDSPFSSCPKPLYQSEARRTHEILKFAYKWNLICILKAGTLGKTRFEKEA